MRTLISLSIPTTTKPRPARIAKQKMSQVGWARTIEMWNRCADELDLREKLWVCPTWAALMPFKGPQLRENGCQTVCSLLWNPRFAGLGFPWRLGPSNTQLIHRCRSGPLTSASATSICAGHRAMSLLLRRVPSLPCTAVTANPGSWRMRHAAAAGPGRVAVAAPATRRGAAASA